MATIKGVNDRSSDFSAELPMLINKFKMVLGVFYDDLIGANCVFENTSHPLITKFWALHDIFEDCVSDLEHINRVLYGPEATD